jgi:hypothetical protein
VSVDGVEVLARNALPNHETFRGRRITLPAASSGYIPHLESTATQLLNHVFEGPEINEYSQQQLFHYIEIGYRGLDLTPRIYLDEDEQSQAFTISTDKAVDTVRVYFDKLAYGFVPHVHNTAATDSEILWARPVYLPPRYYRGIRTHAEFQITYVGDVEVSWWLDGTLKHTYTFSSTEVKTEKEYLPANTVGHVLQYIHNNPEYGGRVYSMETDITMADLEQQSMTEAS